jgi:uncharacterized protein (UPF0333 family)
MSKRKKIILSGDSQRGGQSGFALIMILVVMTIIAAIFFGSSYFSQKSQVETYIEVENTAERMIDEIDLSNLKKQREVDEIMN